VLISEAKSSFTEAQRQRREVALMHDAVDANETSTGAIAIPVPGPNRLERALEAARTWLLARQDAAGFWCGELEGDTTLESYMILIEAFLGRRGSDRSLRLARTIRQEALPGGGWSQYPGGPADLSVSCLSYFALKVAGDDADAAHMKQARAVIRAQGGANRANTYTRYHLALFGQYPWEALPAIPPEMVLLPAWAPFSVYDMSSWSRTIFVPLSILWAKRPRVDLPAACGVPELFHGAPGSDPPPVSSGWGTLFAAVDKGLKQAERLSTHVPGAGALRARAVDKAAAWMIERFPDSDGLSAILPAMANAALALSCLGHGPDEPLLRDALAALDGLLLEDETGALRMQPCLSPVWDTVLACHALAQSGLPAGDERLARAAAWLVAKQTRRVGDWAHRNAAPPGGWYFEHRNELYPDVDDTCMALMVLRQARAAVPEEAQAAAIARGLTWMLGMQNRDGGWASFDRDNDKAWLTQVPFADHNAMIDPSTADITARVLECLSYFPGYGPRHPVVARALKFLRRDQTRDGTWYGRWGVNYLYGTWQVLRGMACVGENMALPHVRRAVEWLVAHQNRDGGWGESIASYADPRQAGQGASTPSQTAWAIMGLVAAGEERSTSVRNGVRHLLERQDSAGTWSEAAWTGTGFPKVFYLGYHLYRHTFPLMALAQYRRAVAMSPSP
jgi:squalene-hopene/tetraprenyl-beta-curcumene cyclase